MDSDDAWKKPKYKNWVRGAKGLEYLQKGLENVVAELVVRQRDQIVQNITSSVTGAAIQCKQCSGNDLLPEHAAPDGCRNKCIQHKSVNCFGSRKKNRRVCPNGVCSKLYDEIVHSHRHKDPLWVNTDPSTWCSDPAGWSFAKCFQTTPSTGKSSCETDAAGLLSIILNDTFFQNEMACNLSVPNNDFCKARTTRNCILLSPKMELEDTELQDCIDIFINVLQDPQRLLRDPTSCEAVQNLVQLKNDEITISLSEEVKLVQVRKEALIALEQLQDKIQEGVNEIETQAQQAQVDIKETKSSVLEQLQKKKEEGVNEIETQAQQAQVDIKETKSSVLEQLQKKKEEGVSEIATQAQEAQVDIKETKSSALEQLQKKKEEGVNEIATQSKEAKADIQEATSSVIEQLQEKEQEVRTDLETQSRQALTKIERKTSSAIEEIGKHEIHQRLRQTEETILHLTNTIQEMKMTTYVQQSQEEIYCRSKQVSQCSENQSVADDKELSAIAEHIGDNWEKLALFLGLRSTQIDHIKLDNPTTATRIYKMLLIWKNMNDDGATVDSLLSKMQCAPRSVNIDWKALGGIYPNIRHQSSVPTPISMQAPPQQSLQQSPVPAPHGGSPADEGYCQLKTNLKKELIDFYRNKHSKFHLSPIMDEEEDTPLLEFYVMPDINVITFERAFGGGREGRAQISDFQGVFFKDDKPSSEIYLTADAGLGKTSFSKRLTLTWCHAKDSNLGHAKYLNSEHATGSNSKDSKYLREEEVKTMDKFDFLFLVFLRNSKDDCHIIDMIMNQIVQELELDNFSQKDIQNILNNERCLVILDGLDEWSHPENSCKRTEKAIPHRKAKQCTILTTTRPWKLSDVKASQIDQKLEIAGLSEKSADCLKERVIPHLCAGKEEKKRVDDFNISRGVAQQFLMLLEIRRWGPGGRNIV